MKRLSTALAPTLMTGALLGIGVVSQAQTNVLGLLGEVPQLLGRGSVFSMIGTLTQANAEAKTTTVQSVFRFDPAFFEVTRVNIDIPGVAESYVVNGARRTFSVSSGAYQGNNVALATTLGIFDEATGDGGFTLTPGTLFIRYDIRVIDNHRFGSTEIGFSDAVINDVPITQGANRSVITTAPSALTSYAGTNQDKPGAFVAYFMPGPSSLTVFAIGALAPMIALLRRRRAR